MIDPVSFGIAAAPSVVKAVMPGLMTRIKAELDGMASDIHHAVFNAFTDYTSSVYAKHLYFSSLVLPNQQLKLKDYYQPLTFLASNGTGRIELLIDDFPIDFLNEKKDLLVVDFAGMGKSTVLKFMFLRAVELDLGIPIFIELRKLAAGESLLTYVFKQLKALNGDVNEQLVVRLLNSGQFIFFLDGFDEITDVDRTGVTSELKEFKRLANKNRFLISSRDQIGLSAFSDFFRLNIKPLTVEEAYSLIRKYSRDSNIGTALIEKLTKPDSAPIIEFLSNPLLVSLLFKAFEFKQTIPLRKHIFYRQVFEALFENHDLSKDAGELNRKKLSDLDIHSFEIVMRAVGFLSLESGKIEYPKDEVILLLEKAKALSAGILFSPQALLQDLVSRVPLFVVDGNYYRWNHRSIQEYFAALYLSSNGVELQQKVLPNMYRSEKVIYYSNFFSLFSDVEAKGFRQIFLPLLLKELILAFDQGSYLESIPLASQKTRRELVAFRHFVFVNLTREEITPYINQMETGVRKPVKPELDFFSIASKMLDNDGINQFGSSGHHAIANDTVVTFESSRLQFIRVITDVINLDFLKIFNRDNIMPRVDLYAENESMPKGFTMLNDDAGNPLNSPQLYDLVNEKLWQTTITVNLDLVHAKKLLDEIEFEIEAQKNKAFSF